MRAHCVHGLWPRWGRRGTALQSGTSVAATVRASARTMRSPSSVGRCVGTGPTARSGKARVRERSAQCPSAPVTDPSTRRSVDGAQDRLLRVRKRLSPDQTFPLTLSRPRQRPCHRVTYGHPPVRTHRALPPRRLGESNRNPRARLRSERPPFVVDRICLQEFSLRLQRGPQTVVRAPQRFGSPIPIPA